MSILAQATTAPTGWAEQIFAVVMLCLIPAAIVLAWWIGVFRRRSISGPARVMDSEPAAIFLLFIGGAVLVVILTQIACLAAMMDGSKSTATTAATTPTTQAISAIANLTPAQMAVSSSVPPLAAFLSLVGVNAKFRPRGLSQLGLTGSQFLPGVLMGLVGSAIAVPLTFLASWGTELLWRYVHYQHDAEHDLLRVLGEEVGPAVSILLVLSATVIAPLAEETLMRGQLQTWLSNALSRLTQYSKRRITARGFEVILPGHEIGYVALPPARDPYDPPAVYIRWVSVIITSVLFALLHPIWMTPPIFVLAICLGYAYERTGNLWTSITMHAFFNTTSTVLYLYVVH